MVKYNGADVHSLRILRQNYHAIYIYTIKACVHLKERTCTKNIFIHKFTVTLFRVEKQTIWAR